MFVKLVLLLCQFVVFRKMWIILLIWCTAVNSLSVEVTSGIYLQRLPNVNPYQITKPILFKFQQPPSLLEQLRCSNFCEFHQNICQIKRASYFSFIVDSVKSKKISENDPILADDGELFDFQFATRNHVTRLFTSSQEIEFLIQHIIEKRQVALHNLNYSNPFQNIFDSLNCFNSTLAEYIQLDFLLKYDWERSFSKMCQNKKLQIDLVPMHTLELVLSLFNNNDNYVPSLTSLASYYTLPLIECALSEETMLVGLHVPLLHRNLQGISMRKVLIPNYAWDNYTCLVDVPTFNLALKEVNSKWNILVPKCDPFKEELCLITDVYDNDAAGVACVKKVLSGGSVKEIVPVCPIKCKETGQDTQFLLPLEINKFLITHPKPQLQISCPDKTYFLNSTFGSLIVTLPCDCQFHDGSEIDVMPRYPCKNSQAKVERRITIPAAWTKLPELRIPPQGESTPKFAELSACLDGEWLPTTLEDHTDRLPYYLFKICLFLAIIYPIFTYFLHRRTQQKFHLYIPYSSHQSQIQQTTTSPCRPTSLTINPSPAITSFVRPRAPEVPPRNLSPDYDYLQPREMPSLKGYVPLSQVMQAGGAVYRQHPTPEAEIYTSPSDPDYVPMDGIKFGRRS